jgi:hypothetical protein
MRGRGEMFREREPRLGVDRRIIRHDKSEWHGISREVGKRYLERGWMGL